MIVTEAVFADDLRMRYGDRVVLDGVQISIAKGEVVALLGPNGAGKTTTIEILEGYREPTSGTVRVLGYDPWDHPVPLRQRVGIVLQECGFPNHVKVEELLDTWRGYYPNPRPTDELLDLVELQSERSARVRRLSGGQRRRLDFALALSGDPEVIFLDEPTTGFDPEARHRCWSVIENLRQLGKTIVLTTHYLDEAQRLADRIAVLDNGRIRATGTVGELAALGNAPTVIRFRPPCVDLTPTNGGMDLRIERDMVEVRTVDTSATLRDLLDRFGDLEDLTVSPPNLEATYLALLHGSTYTPEPAQ